jgi:flagellar biosynthesis protein FlhF
MESQLSERIWKDEAQRSPVRAQILRNLARIGISPDIAAIVVSRLRSMPETNQVWRAPLAELVELLPVKEDRLLSDGGVVAMIGPTGVGKTTSIAKIAARYALLHGTSEIALVCADAYRIGAKEHLAAFGRIIGVQVHSVGESGDLGDLLDGLKSKKLILIDTDGVSQRDTNLINRLADYRKYSDRIDFYLTLSATSQESGLDETIRRFGELPLAGAVISKIDEAGQLGCVMNALIRNELPAVWFSDGQRIPDDSHEGARKSLWLVNQAISCLAASTPRFDVRLMAERYAEASVALA